MVVSLLKETEILGQGWPFLSTSWYAKVQIGLCLSLSVATQEQDIANLKPDSDCTFPWYCNDV